MQTPLAKKNDLGLQGVGDIVGEAVVGVCAGAAVTGFAVGWCVGWLVSADVKGLAVGR